MTHKLQKRLKWCFMTKVSVVLPIYNVAKYLPKCMDSLLKQTLQDVEIICVNDESSDNSLQILEDYAAKDNRIKIINQKNSGPGVARNNGIKAAQGEYIAFCDPDDWVELSAYETLYNAAKENGVDLVEYAITVHEENSRKKQLKNNLYKQEITYINDNPKIIFQGVSAAWNKFCSAKLLKKNNILFSEGYCCEDLIFSVSVRAKAKMILYIDKPFYNYLHRKSSITHKKSAVNLLVPDFINDTLKFLQKENIYPSVKEEFWSCALGLASLHYRKLPKENIDEYKAKCQSIMPEDIYKKFADYTKEKTFLRQLFSFGYNGKVYELTILGIRIKF